MYKENKDVQCNTVSAKPVETEISKNKRETSEDNAVTSVK